MDDRSRIDDYRDALWGVSWGFLIPVTLAAFPAALEVGDGLASGRSFGVFLAVIAGSLILPGMVTAWWLGWRDGNGSVTRSCVVVRWLVLLSLVPIAWGLAYGNFAILEHWMVGLHVPVYLVSRFVSWRRLRKQRLVEMEMEEAGAFSADGGSQGQSRRGVW